MSGRRGSFDEDYNDEASSMNDADNYDDDEDYDACDYDSEQAGGYVLQASIKPSTKDDGETDDDEPDTDEEGSDEEGRPLLDRSMETTGAPLNADAQQKQLAEVESKSPFTLMPQSLLNTGMKNDRGFYLVEVNMMVEGTTRKMAKDATAGIAHLQLSTNFNGFDGPIPGSKRSTTQHAQGNIWLLHTRSTFPYALTLVPGEGLRGRDRVASWSSEGIKGAYTIYPDEKGVALAQPQLLVASDIGRNTEKFSKKFKGKHNKDVSKMWKPIKGNNEFCEVLVDTPLFKAVNRSIKKVQEEMAKTGEKCSLVLLDENSNKAKLDLAEYANRAIVEAEAAILQSDMDNEVNMSNMYETVAFHLKRTFGGSDSSAEETGVASAASSFQSWTSPLEMRSKLKKENLSANEVVSSARVPHMVTAKLLIEYKPLKFAQK